MNALKQGAIAGISAGALSLPFLELERFPLTVLNKIDFYAIYDKTSYISATYDSVQKEIWDNFGF